MTSPRRPSSIRLSNVLAALDSGEAFERDAGVILRERQMLYGWGQLSEADLVAVTEKIAKALAHLHSKAVAKLLDEADARAAPVAVGM